MSLAINLPLPGQIGLTPLVTLKNIQTGQIISSNIPLIETTPGNYTTTVKNLPTITPPLPIPQIGSIRIPVARIVPIEVAVSNIGAIDGIPNVAFGSNVLTPNFIEAEIVPSVPTVIEEIARCPYCFCKIGQTVDVENFIWSDDPTLVQGSKVMSQYRGYMQIKANHIKELQDNRNALQNVLLLQANRVTFTPIDVTNFWRNLETYIYELRLCTERILTEVGVTKEEYFNYAEDGTDMRPGNHQMDWLEIPYPEYALRQYQSKALHIEDLRHPITIGWRETFTGDYPTTDYPTYIYSYNWPPNQGDIRYKQGAVETPGGLFSFDHKYCYGGPFITESGGGLPISGSMTFSVANGGLELHTVQYGSLTSGFEFIYKKAEDTSSAINLPIIPLRENSTATWEGSFSGGSSGDPNQYSWFRLELTYMIEGSDFTQPSNFAYMYITKYGVGSTLVSPSIYRYDIDEFPPTTPINIYNFIESTGKDMAQKWNLVKICIEAMVSLTTRGSGFIDLILDNIVIT